MPTYEYECDNCQHRFEKIQGFSDEPVKECPVCEGPVRRVFHPVGIIFKGSGWYVTDSRKPNPALGKPETAKGDNGSKSEAKPVAETAGNGSKAEKKPESKPAADSKAPAKSS